MNARPSTTPAATAPARSHSLGALLAGLATVESRDERDIHGLSLDSRRVGANDLFIAVPGEERDGRDYIPQAVQNGAVALACEKSPREKSSTASPAQTAEQAPKQAPKQSPEQHDYGVPGFDIKGLKEHIGTIADRFYAHPSAQLRLIGITGTNGKTTCAYLLAQALDLLGQRCALMSTVGTGFINALQPSALTTADAVATHRRLAALLADGADAVCVEASSHGLAQGRVNGVAFDVALFTNLSRDHLDYHRSMERYGRAKGKLFRFDGLHSAVVNVDDPFGRQLLTEHRAAHCLGYGLGAKDGANDGADLRPLNLRLDENGIAFEVEYRGPTSRARAPVHSPLIGELNVPNLLAVIATLVACGYDLGEIAAAVSRCRPPPGRMELLSPEAPSPSRPAVVVDYAHTPDALERALVSLSELCRGKLWVVFGCGGDRDRGKRPLMGAVAERLADRVIVTDDNPRTENPATIVAQIVKGMEAGATAKVTVRHDRRRAIETAIAGAAAGDIVLVAGKGHETTQTIGGRVRELNDRDIVAAVPERGS